MAKSNGEFVGSTKQALSDINGTLLRIEGVVSKQDKRITSLEKWRWLITGGMIILGTQQAPNIFQFVANAMK